MVSHESARFFALAGVFFERPADVEACSAGIEELRVRRGWPNLLFHFKDNNGVQRVSFLESVARFNFTYVVSVLEKRRLGEEWRNKDYFYRHACEKLVSCLEERMRAAYAQTGSKGRALIARTTDPVYIRAMKEALAGPKTQHGQSLVKKSRTGRMESSNMLQLADMVCGAVLRSHNHGDRAFRRLVERREDRLLVWP